MPVGRRRWDFFRKGRQSSEVRDADEGTKMRGECKREVF